MTWSKRVVDVFGALVGLSLLWPAMLVTALMVRIKLGSPVLFRQERPGLGGETFTLVKFRSMKAGPGTDAERLTPFGQTLRATSLDELPELLNVLRGDMSLVGPRPLLVEYLDLYDERQARRHEVRPGLTGLAQVNGRNATAWNERIELDVQYVETASFVLDAKIVLQTLRQLTRRDDVAADGEATMSKFVGSGGES